jgi:indolepyruvate decarboxylase
VAFSVADYVVKRLKEQNVDALFGVPAAYCAPLFDAAIRSGMTTVIDSSDLGAGYAADGYARTRGLAAVSVSYGVGTLSLLNAIAGAYVERSPVVVVNGGPSPGHLSNLHQFDVLFSHSIGQDSTDLTVFKQFTAHAGRADNASKVPNLVDTALTLAITKKRPAYVEISLDIWDQTCAMPAGALNLALPAAGTEPALATKILSLIRHAASPVILVGVEVERYGLADAVATLIAKLNVRWATTLLAKSVIAEQTANFIGVYDGPHSRPAVKNAVESSDCLVALGCVLPSGYAALVRSSFAKMVHAYDGRARVRTEPKVNAELGALVRALSSQAVQGPAPPAAGGNPSAVAAAAAAGLSHAEVFQAIDRILDDTWLVIPDTFLGIYSAANLSLKGKSAFVCSAVWASIGHSVSAAVGASFGSRRRPLVICGDGGFQMTAQSLSTMAHYGRNPVVLLIANGIYGFEQYLVDDTFFTNPAQPARSYVNLNQWDYVKLAGALGFSRVRTVDSTASLDAALIEAKAFNGACLIVAAVKSRDLPVELR